MRIADSLKCLIALGASACMSPGARPHDMSAAKHDQAASEHEHAGESHAALYDAGASIPPSQTCSSPRERRDDFGSDICWASAVNPTEEHLEHAARHRKEAADHRRASAALRNAEASACAGISSDDRDTSPFDHVEDITGVHAYRLAAFAYESGTDRVAGVVVTIRAVPGLTKEWLQRAVDCHLARNAALGHVVPGMPDCPLVPNGAKAKVESSGGGFAVSVSANDDPTSQEIVARARRLARRAGVGRGSE